MPAQTDIVLATLNAKYIHAAFGLRYLFANLGELQPRARIAEFDINQRPLEIAERLLAHEPRIIGFGVYIWNTTLTAEVIAILKRLRPELVIILGGPEVSFEVEQQAVTQLADYVITGEADLKFAEVCRVLLDAGGAGSPLPAARRARSDAPDPPKIIPAELPDFSQLTLPYACYTQDDIAHRIIYVEASRGCPFTCEFCLSSLDVPVRAVAIEPFLAEMQRLLDRGVQQFKFVDRTFNLNIATSRAILEFFLERLRPGLFLHFEMIPDRLPEALRELIAKFPAGTLQFEVGIQTFNEETAQLISRRQNYEKLADNLRFLREHTGVHIHADLIIGLPGESMASFAAGFDRLVGLGPQEIQVGILKRLRGTPIVRHDVEWQMVYSPLPPYEILQNKLIDFPTIQRLRRFARFWDLVGNSGNFVETTPLLWRSGGASPPEGGRDASVASGSPFDSCLRLSDWLFEQVGRQHSIALSRLEELLFRYLTEHGGRDVKLVADTLWRDHQRSDRHDVPPFLRPHLPQVQRTHASSEPLNAPRRQHRHLAKVVPTNKQSSGFLAAE